MRILQVILASRLSGAEVLAKGVAIGHQRYGHDVCIASLMPQHDDFAHISAELYANGVVCRFPTKSLGKIGRLLFLHVRSARFGRTSSSRMRPFPRSMCALPTRVPIVWVMHSGANDFANRALLCAERLLSNRAKAVIGVSQKNIDNYVKEVGLHPLMIVVPNGVDVSSFADDSLPAMPAARKQIVQVGRYIPEKNQLQTVEVFAHVARAEPQARLLLCGVIENLAYHRAVVERVAELGLTERVVIEGPQTNVAQILRASSVYAMPSSFEAHSIGFLEALASGILVVASAIPSFAFASTFSGVQLLDTSDSVAYGRALLEALTQAAHQASAQWPDARLSSTADHYLDIARDVLNLRVGLSG